MAYDLNKTIARGDGGRIYATISTDNHVRMVCLGDHETVRYWFNQIACLVGGMAVQKLRTFPPAPGRVVMPDTKPPGHWEDKLFATAPVSTPESLFNLAARGPSPDADRVGILAFCAYWPQDMWRIPGIQPFTKSVSESLGRVFYDCLQYPMVRVGTSAEQTVARRTHEAIAVAKRAGYPPHDEPALLRFLETLTSARCLQLIHEVIDHA
jgi:hypothetical protein